MLSQPQISLPFAHSKKLYESLIVDNKASLMNTVLLTSIMAHPAPVQWLKGILPLVALA